MQATRASFALVLMATGESRTDLHTLSADTTYLIGSDPSADVRVAHEEVAAQHALIKVSEGVAELIDLDGGRRTRVNGNSAKRVQLEIGDEVQFGPIGFRLLESHPDDERLALSFGPAFAPAEPVRERRVQLPAKEGEDHARSGSSTGLIFDLARVLEASDLDAVVGYLREAVGAGDGGGIARGHRDREPEILAASGDLATTGLREEIYTFTYEALERGEEGVVDLRTWRDRIEMICGALYLPPDGYLGLALWDRKLDLDLAEALIPRVLFGVARRIGQPSMPLEPPYPVPLEIELPPEIVPAESLSMRSVYREVTQLGGGGSFPVLLLGETGVGKEHLARLLHTSSPRGERAFVAVNCSAIPKDLLEAEMFGVRKGAATGVESRQGLFERADGGTLLLDEIGDMPLPLQAKLLRALEGGVIHPVGGGERPVDVRVVAATNADLQLRIEDGRFRADLYYRIAGYTVRIPPLRDRRQDIPPLVRSFTRRFATDLGKSIQGISIRCLTFLTGYSWPGNVRELRHEVRRLVYVCPEGGIIDSRLLPERLLELAPEMESPYARLPADLDSLEIDEHLIPLEASLIREALRRTDGNKSEAARLLGLSRNGLTKKMRRLAIEEP